MAKNTTNTATDYIDAMRQSFESMGARMEVPEVARDAMRKSVSTAGEGLDKFESGMTNVTTGADKMITTAIDGYRSFNRELLETGFANMRLALDGFAKLAEAKTMSEAMQIQAEIVREGAQSNMDRARKQAEMARDIMADNVRTVQAEANKVGKAA